MIVYFDLFNQDDISERYKSGRSYLPKGIINNDNFIINKKNFYTKTNEAHIKRYEEIRKLTTGQDEAYRTGCLLDYKYIKNYYRLTAVGFRRKKIRF